MNKGLFVFLIFSLQGICWWFSRLSSKNSKGEADYFLGGREISFFPLMMTFVATQIGGGLILGSAEEARQWGWWVLFYPIGQVLGLFGLAFGIGRRLANYSVSTVAQIFEVYYRSPFFKYFASFLSIASLFLILAAQVVASKKFMMSLGITEAWIFFLFWFLLIGYTAIGGIKGVIATDVIQALYFIVVLFVAGAVGFSHYSFAVPVESSFPSFKISGWLFMPLLFTFIEQDMGQRCFAAGSNTILSKATLWGGVATLLVTLVPVYFGVLGSQLDLPQTEGGSFLMSTVVYTTSPVIASFVGCAVLAAILSTANSLINAVGSNLSQDFNLVKNNRLIALVIGFLAVLISTFFTNVVDLMILAYELSVVTLLVPLLIALFSKREGNLLAGITSAGMGALGLFIFRNFSCPIPEQLAALGLSFAGYFLADLRRSVATFRFLK